MQLADNPITKIIFEKLKRKDFTNLNHLIFNEERSYEFQYELLDFKVDITRQSLDKEIKRDLIDLAKEINIKAKISELVSGTKVNLSENRSVDHFNLRKKERFKTQEWKKLQGFVKKIQNKNNFKHIINIGIGGSDLGPLMVNQALKSFYKTPEILYVSNIDPINISEIFINCDPKTTLFIITTKSFSTLETLENAKIVAEWLSVNKVALNDSMVAVTSIKEKALNWGFNESNIFEISENVGGRYSLWSSVGMSIFIGLGEENYKNFLLGARTMDEHFINEEVENNIPIILALLRIWNRNFLNRNNHCIVPYSDSLSKLPSWAQQLEMESNGKGVDINGATLKMPASPLIWGEVGTNAQHSFFQFLHQGLEVTPIDILIPRKPLKSVTFKGSEENHEYLFINAIAQAEALARGSVDLINQNKNFLGGRPSTIISWEENTPFSIGMLIALYENITIASGFLWNINSFDQWGVELGKTIANKISNNKNDKNLTPAAKKFLNEK